MPLTYETIYVLLLLLPGFVSLAVENALVFQINRSNFDKIASALLYSFINYVFLSFFKSPLFVISTSQTQDGKTNYSIGSDWKLVLILLIFAVVLGCSVGYLKTNDILMEIARRLNLTKRSARNSIWLDIFHDKYSKKKERKKKEKEEPFGAYITAFLKDDRIVYGWPEYFSDSYSDGPVLFLTKAKWILKNEENEEYLEIPYPGILLNASEIKYLQFFTHEGDEND